jgi:hypothetical protein
MRHRRYRNLLKTIYKYRCQSILEIGTYDGVHACQMIETAGIFHPVNRIKYYGFDLFDALTDEDLQKEASKRPPSLNEVKQKIQNTGADISLYPGYSKDTLPGFLEENRDTRIDFIFIDGGHSIETISNDWNHVKKLMHSQTIVIFDDYYNNLESEVKGVGCQSIINGLDRNIYAVEMLKPQDCFKKKWGTLKVNMVKVRLK